MEIAIALAVLVGDIILALFSDNSHPFPHTLSNVSPVLGLSFALDALRGWRHLHVSDKIVTAAFAVPHGVSIRL